MDNEFRQDLQRRFMAFQEELWRPLYVSPPALLYHYTGPESVRDILQTQELWVSDIRRLNDTTEGTYSLDVLRPVLQRKSVPTRVLDLFGRELYRIGEIWFHYVASFCAAKDVDTQWNDYAVGGTGCALAIDLESLSQKSKSGKEFAVVKLLYDEADQRAKMEAAIDHAIQLSRELEVRKRELYQFWIEAIIYSLLPCGVRFKHSRYTCEQEWRVLIIRPNQSAATERTLPDGGQTRYLRLSLDSSLVKGVLLGPRCSYSVEEAKRMLSANGFTEAPVIPNENR
jgi:hypothetical protein